MKKNHRKGKPIKKSLACIDYNTGLQARYNIKRNTEGFFSLCVESNYPLFFEVNLALDELPCLISNLLSFKAQLEETGITFSKEV